MDDPNVDGLQYLIGELEFENNNLRSRLAESEAQLKNLDNRWEAQVALTSKHLDSAIGYLNDKNELHARAFDLEAQLKEAKEELAQHELAKHGLADCAKHGEGRDVTCADCFAAAEASIASLTKELAERDAYAMSSLKNALAERDENSKENLALSLRLKDQNKVIDLAREVCEHPYSVGGIAEKLIDKLRKEGKEYHARNIRRSNPSREIINRFQKAVEGRVFDEMATAKEQALAGEVALEKAIHHLGNMITYTMRPGESSATYTDRKQEAIDFLASSPPPPSPELLAQDRRKVRAEVWREDEAWHRRAWEAYHKTGEKGYIHQMSREYSGANAKRAEAQAGTKEAG
ncbi:hypothetical protein LCGC14_1471760 [marine sediment metagenome]|uniref:Uncharacterized protein n=1 Tax=marine sediment metagenome TaxID=412755 RepID=A0A0F9LSN6_9ZZZZ